MIGGLSKIVSSGGSIGGKVTNFAKSPAGIGTGGLLGGIGLGTIAGGDSSDSGSSGGGVDLGEWGQEDYGSNSGGSSGGIPFIGIGGGGGSSSGSGLGPLVMLAGVIAVAIALLGGD
ncbi:hypothetical protein [Natrinema versiforme]|uniref:Uncharacterized protein n=1 Tax=Natrinema versiforme JCM 10478 TaxID=1227496 RepID=L9Y8T8_9EURY|nr:hypothetical protein [Natrinema versiforme]ELY69333.1 hypothetical protein C489_05248 [Natrinema versiforme JCM 10478]